MPRNRTVRLAVLGSSVQRAAAAKSPSRARAALTRRVIVGVLVLLSLVMITLSFRAGETGGGLDNLQATGATILRPFQVGIERVVRPFRDLYGYTSGLVDAKREVNRLRAENARLRQEAIRNEIATQQNQGFRKALRYLDSPQFPHDYNGVAAAVISYPPTTFVRQLGIAAGWGDGVRLNDPVVNADGLVGKISKVADRTALVTLLNDEQMAVSATDVHTRAAGIVKPGQPGSDLLALEDVPKSRVVRKGDYVVTAGSQRGDALQSLYPRGIAIGRVVSVTQDDVYPFKRIQLDPAVNFDSVDSVIVLVPKRATR